MSQKRSRVKMNVDIAKMRKAGKTRGKYRRDCWISSGRGDFLMRFILDIYIMDK